jgi:hypothetical protein
MMGRFGGRSSIKAGARDMRVLAMDGGEIQIDPDYDPITGGNIISFDAARSQRPAQRGSAELARRQAAAKQGVETRKRNQAEARFQSEKKKTLSAFGKIRGNIAESMMKAREEANKPRTDAKGTTLKNGRAFTNNGTVVAPNLWYQPRGMFKGGTYFLCHSLEWHGDNIIAVGEVEYPGYANKVGKWFYPSDLKPAQLAGQGRLRSQKELFGLEM